MHWLGGFAVGLTVRGSAQDALVALDTIHTTVGAPLCAHLAFTGLTAHPPLGPEGARELARSDATAELSGLDLRGQLIGDDGLDALSTSPHLTRLRHLNLSGHNDLSKRALGILTRSDTLCGLETLGLTAGPIHEDISALFEPGALPRLRSLSLTNADQLSGLADVDASKLRRLLWTGQNGVAFLQQLLHNDTLRSLGALAMFGRLSDHAVQALAACPHLVALEELDLALARGIGPASAIAMAQSPTLAGLRRLGWHGVPIGDKGVTAIADAELPSLAELDLGNTSLTKAGVMALCRGRDRPALRRLHLARNRLGPEAMEVLAASPLLASVQQLTLYMNHIGDRGTKALAQSPHVGRLLELDLSVNQVGVQGMRALGRSGALTSLRHLVIRGDRRVERHAGIRGLHALLTSSTLRTLHHLELRSCGFDDGDARAIEGLEHLGPPLLRLDLAHNLLGAEGLHILDDAPALDDVVVDVRHNPGAEALPTADNQLR